MGDTARSQKNISCKGCVLITCTRKVPSKEEGDPIPTCFVAPRPQQKKREVTVACGDSGRYSR